MTLRGPRGWLITIGRVRTGTSIVRSAPFFRQSCWLKYPDGNHCREPLAARWAGPRKRAKPWAAEGWAGLEWAITCSGRTLYTTACLGPPVDAMEYRGPQASRVRSPRWYFMQQCPLRAIAIGLRLGLLRGLAYAKVQPRPSTWGKSLTQCPSTVGSVSRVHTGTAPTRRLTYF